MSNIPLSILKKSLDNKLGKDTWKDFEEETLLIETGLEYSDILMDKLNALKVIENKPDLFFEDAVFLIYATAVMNNDVANFSHLPHITSLEVAFAINEMARIWNTDLHLLPEFGLSAKYFIRDLLINEGYSEVLPPFDIVGLGELPKGQTEQDTLDKKKAIEDYIHAMYR